MQHNHILTEKINYNKRFFLGIVLNLSLVIGQIFYGIRSNSVALISDGFHNAGDVFALMIAWGGFYLANLKSSERFTYGFKNTTIIAAFINAVLLFMAVGAISWEAISRLRQPQDIDTHTVIIVALIGVIINGISAVMFMTSREDINIRGAFIHMLSDAAVSIGVVVASIIIFFTELTWIDPALCIGISCLIIITSWGIFRESINLILHAAPKHINIHQVRNFLLNQKNVKSVHDLHIWAISTTETALSAHLVTTSLDTSNQDYLHELAYELEKQFSIHHVTIQIENAQETDSCENTC